MFPNYLRHLVRLCTNQPTTGRTTRAARGELRCVVAFIFRRFWIEPRNNPLSIVPEISGESIPSCHCRYPQKLGLVGIADLGVHRILPRCTITWPGLPAAPPLAPNPPPDGWGYLRSLTTSRTPDTCATTVCACSAVAGDATSPVSVTMPP